SGAIVALVLATHVVFAAPARSQANRDTDAASSGVVHLDNWLLRLEESQRELVRLDAQGARAAALPPVARTSSGAPRTLAGAAHPLVNPKSGDSFGSAQVEPCMTSLGPWKLCAFNTDKFPRGGDGITAEFNFSSGFGPWTDVPLPPAAGPMSKWIADPV